MGRATWTAEQRSAAVELAQQVGPSEAARRTGIPAGTVASWMHRAGVHTANDACTEQTRVRVQAAKLRWAERRTVMVEEIGAAAHMALAQTVNALADGQSTDAKNLATTMAILVDKAQLLGGDATQRTEVARAQQRLEQARDELARRRSARQAA